MLDSSTNDAANDGVKVDGATGRVGRHTSWHQIQGVFARWPIERV